METEHSETVVEKAVAYVKDMFGIPPGDRTPDVEAKPEYTDTAPELTSEDGMRLDPHAHTFNKIVERSRRTSMDTEQENSAAGAHTQAAAQIDHAKGLVGQALGEIDDISRGMKEKIVAETDGRTLPSDGEMEQAVERARDADNKEKSRQAEEQSNWRSAMG